jgi:hypothetical protein
MNRSTTQCSANTTKGRRCRRQAIPGSDPLCPTPNRESLSGNAEAPLHTNAQTHGVYTSPLDTPVDLDARINDLNRRIEQLSHYIDQAPIGGTDGLDVDQYARLLSLHGQLTSRLGRLLRDRAQMSPEDDSFLQGCINEALDQVSEILGVKL